MNRVREYINNNRTLVNIILVYFFLSFVTGYIDFDRRVYDFEKSAEYLKMVVERNFNPPMVHRILVPYTLYFLHRVSHVSLSYVYAFFRLIFYFLAFVLFHIYLRRWFNDKLAMIGTLSLIAALPLTLSNWYAIPTDMPELICFILGAMWIKENKHKLLYFLIPIATLNKETAIALVVLYFLNGLGNRKPRVLLLRSAVYFLLWLVPYGILLSVFGQKVFGRFHTVIHNFNGLWYALRTINPYNPSWGLIYLYGFYWVLAFRDFRKKDAFLRKSVIVMALFFLYAFCKVGAINEVRIFVPFSVFIIPLGLHSLFDGESHEKVSR